MARDPRGFAGMNRNKQREIASKGGKAAHAKGTAHEWSREQAREAGRKGGLAARRGENADRVVDSAESRQHAASRITFACGIGAQKRRRTLTAETELQWVKRCFGLRPDRAAESVSIPTGI